IDRSALSIGMCRTGKSFPAGPAMTPHASSGWSRRAGAKIASPSPLAVGSTAHSPSLGSARSRTREVAAMHADLVLHGGAVHAVQGAHTRPGPTATAVAVRTGRVLAVGEDPDILGYAGPETEVFDLAGGTLLPGFQDAHAHPPTG